MKKLIIKIFIFVTIPVWVIPVAVWLILQGFWEIVGNFVDKYVD
jgi:hypothetical protein